MLASDTMLVRLSGEHDASTKTRLADAFVAVRNQANVIVDLTRCSFIDSSIVTTMRRAHAALTRDQGRLVVVLPAEPNAVTRTAELVHFAELLPTYTSLEAVASFGQIEPAITPA